MYLKWQPEVITRVYIYILERMADGIYSGKNLVSKPTIQDEASNG